MNDALLGKVALITGGSRGIGAAIAKRLAQDGAAVAFTYAHSLQTANDLVRDIQATAGRALAIQADNADVEAVRRAIAETVTTFGRLDILINNAGVATFTPIDQFTLEKFDRAIAVNVRGAFVATQEAIRHMDDGGRIIMIGSINSDVVPFKGGSVYALTKGAIASFTRGLARDLGPRGITVNTIQPGPVNTDMNPEDSPSAEVLKRSIAIGRYGQAEEIAGLVAYLVSPAAAYVTGASLKIDGGLSA